MTFVAINPGRASADKNRRLEKLLRLQRLRLEQNPSALAYTEIADTLSRMGNYAEAATTVEQLIAKYPDAKSVRTLVFLADYHRRAGHIEAAKATLREAMKLDPGDGESQFRWSTCSARSARSTTRFRSCATRPRKSPTTRLMS